jgi:uncharacterized protein with PIN domain
LGKRAQWHRPDGDRYLGFDGNHDVQYGRGRSPAALNFGDCFSYALAKARGDMLLFKGDDFLLTDIVPAWRP